MKIAIIGAGNVGSALAEGLVRAGHQVTFGMRGTSAASALQGASIASVAEAIAPAEVVILAVPWDAIPDVISAAKSWNRKVIVDCTNPIGAGFELRVGHTNSGGEQLAALAKGARVVKAFNTTGFGNMRSPTYDGMPASMLFATDDSEARNIAVKLIQDVGFDPIYAGPLKQARYLEPMAMLWISMTREYGRDFVFAMLRR